MSSQAISASLEFLAWRDAQMASISEQLEDAYPALLAELDKLAETESLVQVALATVSVETTASEVIKVWSEEQSRIALGRAQADLEDALAAFPADLDVRSSTWNGLSAAFPAAAGVGLIAGSLAAIPTVVSFATVTTSTFAIFATATISWPLFAVGALGIATASLLGSTALVHAAGQARESLKERLREVAARTVFGTGLAPDARCLHNDLQALVYQAGVTRLQEAA